MNADERRSGKRRRSEVRPFGRSEVCVSGEQPNTRTFEQPNTPFSIGVNRRFRGGKMIVRVFRATVHPGGEADFERFLRETGIPAVTQCTGVVSTCVGRPMAGGRGEFVFVSVWRDLAALQGFAGARWREPVIHPSEAAVIARAEVEHYELLA